MCLISQQKVKQLHHCLFVIKHQMHNLHVSNKIIDVRCKKLDFVSKNFYPQSFFDFDLSKLINIEISNMPELKSFYFIDEELIYIKVRKASRVHDDFNIFITIMIEIIR